nr:PREDICTED: acyl-coenzyme A oxidase-like protein [Rhinolophus sinicus]
MYFSVLIAAWVDDSHSLQPQAAGWRGRLHSCPHVSPRPSTSEHVDATTQPSEPKPSGKAVLCEWVWENCRRQFGPKAQEEVKIIEHQTQTLRLMPHLATTLALVFASRYAGGLLDKDIFRGKELVDSRALQALVAGLKAYSTWENVRCLQDCREGTGGMGYMMENRISGLKCDTDVFVTFEGDNVVMLQVVARELLAQHAKQYEERPLVGLLQSWAESGGDKLRTRNYF